MLMVLQDLVLRKEVLHAYTRSIATIWIVITPLVGLGFLLSKSCPVSSIGEVRVAYRD